MTKLNTLLLSIIFSIYGCTSNYDPEEMIYIADSHERQYFINLLKTEGVNHWVSKKEQVFYYVKHRAEIDKVKSKVSEQYRAGCGFKLQSKENHNKLAITLESNNIPFWVVQKDDGKWFVCKSKYTSEAQQYLHSVMSID